MKWTPKVNDTSEWHEWFAWHPVTIDGQTVWLETILRYEQWSPVGSYWIYEEVIEIRMLSIEEMLTHWHERVRRIGLQRRVGHD